MPSASSKIATLGTVVINTGVDFFTMIFTNFWPYVLGFGALVGLIYWVKRAVGFGSR
jgi:hypothetical protein